MIIAIPALGVIVQQAIQAIAVGAIIGGVTGAGAGAVVEAVQSANEHGEINREVMEDVARGAWNGGKDGLLIGGAFGPVILVVGPVIAPAIQVLDDIAAPVIQIADDVAGPVFQAADSATRPVFNGIGMATHSLAMSTDKAVYVTTKHVRNGAPPFIQRLLPKANHSVGYVYAMDDAASGAHKIGLSIDPKRRLSEVKSPSGVKPKIACTIPTYNMKALEGSLHAAFTTQNLPNTGAGREWFNLSASQVKAICN